MNKPRVSVIIPTYNEADNIELLLDRLTSVLRAEGFEDYEIIAVDDNSSDGTCDIVRRKSREDPRIKCILRVNEKGLSSAVVEGFKNASGEILVVMDADLQHPPETVPRLVEAVMRGADVAVASRYGRGGGVAGWSRLRLLMSRIATIGVKILVREAKRTTDPLSGFFAVRRDALRLGDLKPKGFKILLEILARHPCLKVVDVPYVFQRRHGGESKLGFFVVTDFISQSWEISPMPKFLIVGASGILVNLAVMWVILALTGHVDIASIGGIEASIISNFVLHELITFRHYFRRDCRGRGMVKRLILYHRASLASVVTTYLVMRLLVTLLNANPLLGQFLGILLGFAVNYMLSVETVWECGIHGGCKRNVQ
ncbi:MAG: glycosyltransferase family 2 protein [Desulfurococcales archaeon]|nr:glycosyltransferase family 2 protein [Desulfurococcales archaeon]